MYTMSSAIHTRARADGRHHRGRTSCWARYESRGRRGPAVDVRNVALRCWGGAGSRHRAYPTPRRDVRPAVFRRPTSRSGRIRRRRAGHLVGRKDQIGRLNRVTDRLQARGPGYRDDHRGLRQHPGERHLLRRDAAFPAHDGELGVPRAEASGPRATAERAPRQKRDPHLVAQLELALARPEAGRVLVLHRGRSSPSTSCAARICSGSALEMPAMRSSPRRAGPSAPIDTSYGTFGSGRWNW